VKKLLSTISIYSGIIVWFVTGIWTIIIDIKIVGYALSDWGLFAYIGAVIFFPVTFLVAPFYAWLQLEYSFPLILTYGGTILGAILFFISFMLSENGEM